MRLYVVLLALLFVAACSASNTISSLPATHGPASAKHVKGRVSVSDNVYPTPYPESTLLQHAPDGPHTFGDMEGATSLGRGATTYTVTLSGNYPPYSINPAYNQVAAGNAVTFLATDPLTCVDNEPDVSGLPNGTTITAAAVAATPLPINRAAAAIVDPPATFGFTLKLGPDNISPPTQFGCRFYFQDSANNIHRITLYAGGPTAHPMTIAPNTVALTGTYPFVNAPTQTITVSEPDANNAFYFGRTGSTFDGTPLCSSVDGATIGECRDAAPNTYDVNVAGAGFSVPPPHLLLQNLGAPNNHTLTLTYSGAAPIPVGSVTTMMIFDASGDYAPLTVTW